MHFALEGRPLQILAAISGGLSSISDGMHSGWTAPALPALEAQNSTLVVTETNETWIESIYMVAGFLGLPLTLLLIDRIGGKNLILLAAGSSLLAWIMLAVANRIEYLYVARFMTGIAEDMAFITTPMYVSEIADEKIRGFLVGMVNMFSVLGILIVYWLVPYVSLVSASIFGSLVIVLQLVTLPLMPESPYYHLKNNRSKNAENSLNKFRNSRDNKQELAEISRFIEGEHGTQVKIGKLKNLFLNRHNQKSLIICVVLTIAQNFCGYNIILMNVHNILTKTDSYRLSSDMSAILYALSMVIASGLACTFVDKLGRKFLIIVSGVLSSIFMLCLAVYLHLESCGYEDSLVAVNWLPIISCMGFGFFFKAGLGIVPAVLFAELFAMDVKVLGMCVTDAVYTISATLTIALYYWLKNFSFFAPFYVFTAVGFATVVFTIFFVPETKGKTFEEIQDILKMHSVKKVRVF